VHYRLALALGFPHPEVMKRRLTARQLRDWEVFNSVEPIGDVRGDVQAAIIAQATVSPYRKKGHKPPALKDFMPFYHEDDTPRAKILRNFLSYAHTRSRSSS
jgi:hypothetical protein